MSEREKSHVQCVLPNLFFEFWADQKIQAGEMRIHPFMDKLVRRVSKTNPSWKIYATTRAPTGEVSAAGDEVFHLVRFRFESAAREELGTMHKGYGRNGQTAFAIDNVRMSQVRNRGDATYTGDESRAFKLIKANFRPSPLGDLVTERDRAAGQAINRISNIASNAYRGTYNTLSGMMTTFAETRWEEFEAYIREAGSEQQIEALDAFSPINEHLGQANALIAERNINSGATVYLRDGEYIMRRGKDTEIKLGDQLTFEERACLGLLQIAPVGTFAPNYGVRVSEDTFYITPALVPPRD